MLTDLTAAKIDHGLAALRAAQLLGEHGHGDDGELVPEPGEVSGRYLAACCGVSLRTIQLFEQRARQKFIAALQREGLTPNAAALILDHLDPSNNSDQPQS